MWFLNPSLVNEEKFVCANCGHERHDHDNREGLCHWRQHGALRACKCYRYEPSEMEKWFEWENWRRSQFSKHSLRVLKYLRDELHQFHIKEHNAPEQPALCSFCREDIKQFIFLGERAFDCINPNK